MARGPGVEAGPAAWRERRRDAGSKPRRQRAPGGAAARPPHLRVQLLALGVLRLQVALHRGKVGAERLHGARCAAGRVQDVVLGGR